MTLVAAVLRHTNQMKHREQNAPFPSHQGEVALLGPGILTHISTLLWALRTSLIPEQPPDDDFFRRTDFMAVPGIIKGLRHCPELPDSFHTDQSFS